MKLNYEGWEKEYMTIGNAFPIPTYKHKLGKDDNGKVWHVYVKFSANSGLYEIGFDYEDENDPLFLKDKVLFALDYWRAKQAYYNAKIIKYEQFNKEIDRFALEHGIKEEE